MQVIVNRNDIDALFVALQRREFQILGPTVRDNAIVYDEISSSADLPVGWTEKQSGGSYRLQRRNDAALFGYTVGPHSWKQFLHPPAVRLWRARQEEQGFHVTVNDEAPPRFAFIGARSCELHAIAVQDTVFLGGSHADPIYKTRRDNIFVIAVHCGQAGGSCFCVSMQTGPKATMGFDLALTEVLDGRHHYFVVDIGTESGATVMDEIPHREVTEHERQVAEDIVAKAARQMGRQMDTNNIKNLLYQNYEHPRWDDVANRCLSCSNCTMVCPTCFCTAVEDTTDLTGEYAERWRKWDSCFTLDFTHLHGGSVRTTTKSRYRQWMTHKLATWIDQFGVSGCVGCGRCITWCPVGIDITEEVAAMRGNADAPRSAGGKPHDPNA